MNAYELADELDRIAKVSMPLHYITESANMLRQQAGRIERLEAEAKAKNNYLQQHCQKIDEQADRIAGLEKETHSINYICPNCETHVELFYKTPQIKELSDEEIDSLIAEYKIGEFSGFYVDKAMTESMQRRYKNVLDFAKAILKKASEK